MQSSHERSAAVDKAARCITRGELDTALRLYLQIFDNDPHDWAVGNSLGDLYVRLGKPDDAVSHFTMLAEQLVVDGFAAKARALYRKIVRLQPGNQDARRRVDELERQQASTTSPFLKRVLETARTMRESAAAEARPAQPLPAEPEVVAPVAAEPPNVAAPPLETPAPVPPVIDAQIDETAEQFTQMDVAAGSAMGRGDPRAAAAIVERFLAAHPQHVLALVRLVEIGIEANSDRELLSAQERLAEALLMSGDHRQAFDIAVDLREREPHEPRHRERLDRIVQVGRAHGRTFVAPPLEAEEEPVVIEPSRPRLVPSPVAPSAVMPPPVPPAVVQAAEPVAAPAPALAAIGRSIAIGPPFGDLLKEWSDPERSLEDIRSALLEDNAAAAEDGFRQALRLIDARQYAEVARLLEEAMCLPHLRVPAGSQLARVHRDTGAPEEALAVLEWVAAMPPADEDSGHELAYELALALEALGQDAQALGVYRELIAEVGPEYRDVSRRAQRLAAA